MSVRTAPLVTPTLGRRIAALRVVSGMHQKECAELLGIAPSQLCDIEKGKRGVSVTLAARYAVLLGDDVALYVRLVLQEQLDAAGLPYRVRVRRIGGKA